MRGYCAILMFLLSTVVCYPAAVSSGPMIGYVTMSEVLVWVQTDAEAEVVIRYWETETPDQYWKTDAVRTNKQNGYVAKCYADAVKSDTNYSYEVWVDGALQSFEFRPEFKQGSIPLSFKTPPNWRFRESGHEVKNFTLGFGSCAYINQEGGYDRLNGKPYGGDYHIFESIYDVKPDVFVWLGDNIYYREPDWTSRTGMIKRWTHDRSIPQIRPLLATIPNYATWDDHDYGPNDSGRTFWNKGTATEIFTLFNGNPSAGLPETPGIFTYFSYGDVNVYLLDNRTYRTAVNLETPSTQPSFLGYEQIDWLVEDLKYRRGQSRSSYPSTFNLICIGNQIIGAFGRDTSRNFQTEWQYLMQRLTEEKIHNVVFVSGDVHFGEVNRTAFHPAKGEVPVELAKEDPSVVIFHEVTTSPLTSGSWKGPETDVNPFRFDIFKGDPDRVSQRNFATLAFEGDLKNRQMIIRYFDADGQLLNGDASENQVTEESIIIARNLNLRK